MTSHGPTGLKDGLGHDLSCPSNKFIAERIPPSGAGYFAHDGASSQSPLISVSAWRRKLRPLPCSSASRRTRCAGLRRETRRVFQNAIGENTIGLRRQSRLILYDIFPGPHYEERTSELFFPIRRAKPGWSPRLRRALGPGCAEIWSADAIEVLRLVPTNCAN